VIPSSCTSAARTLTRVHHQHIIWARLQRSCGSSSVPSQRSISSVARMSGMRSWISARVALACTSPSRTCAPIRRYQDLSSSPRCRRSPSARHQVNRMTLSVAVPLLKAIRRQDAAAFAIGFPKIGSSEIVSARAWIGWICGRTGASCGISLQISWPGTGRPVSG
jgi:hypothetical protein